METKLLQQLVLNSFDGNVLDEKKAVAIADKLDRPNLRKYIKLLKKYIAEHTVIVEAAFAVDTVTKNELEEQYKDKKITYVVNKDLMLGIRITENDIIFSKNLRDTLENITEYITN